jgi:hypothetical protein
MFGEEGNLVEQTNPGIFVTKDASKRAVEAFRVPNGPGSCRDCCLCVCISGQQADCADDARPRHPCVPDQLKEDILSKDAPSLSSSPLNEFVDNPKREHHDDRAGDHTSKQCVLWPEISAGLVGDDASNESGESD